MVQMQNKTLVSKKRNLMLPYAVEAKRQSFNALLHKFFLFCKGVTDKPEQRGLPFIPNEILHHIWSFCKPIKKLKNVVGKINPIIKTVEKVHKLRHGKYRVVRGPYKHKYDDKFIKEAAQLKLIVAESYDAEKYLRLANLYFLTREAEIVKREYDMGSLVRERKYQAFWKGDSLQKELVLEINRDKGIPHGYALKKYDGSGLGRNVFVVYYQGHFDHGKKVGLWKEITCQSTQTVMNYSEPSPRFCLEYVQDLNGEIILQGKGNMEGKKKVGKWKYYYQDNDRKDDYAIVKYKDAGSAVYKEYTAEQLTRKCIARKKGNKTELSWEVSDEEVKVKVKTTTKTKTTTRVKTNRKTTKVKVTVSM